MGLTNFLTPDSISWVHYLHLIVPLAGVTLEKPFTVSLGRLWDQTQGKLVSVFPAV